MKRMIGNKVNVFFLGNHKAVKHEGIWAIINNVTNVIVQNNFGFPLCFKTFKEAFQWLVKNDN